MQDIFTAIETHDLMRLAQLLEAGADPNVIDKGLAHVRPLHAAIVALTEGASLDAIDLLLRHGADMDATYPGVGAATPLLGALFNGELAAARHLLDLGADPAKCGDEGDTPLRWAVENGGHAMLELLLQKGAGKTIDKCDPIYGRSALGMAVDRLDVRMVRLLLEAGADADARDLNNKTAEECLPPRTAENEAAFDQICALVTGT